MDDRKLNELAAEKIFDLETCLNSDGTRWERTKGKHRDQESGWKPLRNYLTGDGMLRVIERMRQLGWWMCDVSYRRRWQGATIITQAWRAWFESDDEEGPEKWADTAPRAVLLAALRAMGVDIDAIRDS